MAIKLTVMTDESVKMTAEPSIVIDHTTPYDGAYEWTPSNSTQTIPISGRRALENITINPIPSNYGLITWNGSELTVS